VDFVHSIGQSLNGRRERGTHWLGEGARRRRFEDACSCGVETVGYGEYELEEAVDLRLLEAEIFGRVASSDGELEGPAIRSAARPLIGAGITDLANSSVVSCVALRTVHLLICRLRFEFTPNRRPQSPHTKAGIHSINHLTKNDNGTEHTHPSRQCEQANAVIINQGYVGRQNNCVTNLSEGTTNITQLLILLMVTTSKLVPRSIKTLVTHPATVLLLWIGAFIHIRLSHHAIDFCIPMSQNGSGGRLGPYDNGRI
jgi:hypothetical protein